MLSSRVDVRIGPALTIMSHDEAMTDEFACDLPVGDDLAFVELLEARCSGMHALTGRVEPLESSEGTRPEIRMIVPGERALAEIAYRTADGRVQRRAMSERQIAIIPSNQPHQLFWRRGSDLTEMRIAPDFLDRIARESGMRGAEVVGQYGAVDPTIWHLGRELRAELRRHRKLEGDYVHSMATVLTRHLLSTYVAALRIPVEENGLPRFKVRRAIEYVHDNLINDISFRDVAAHVKMSAHHFARMFRQSTGTSPHNYIVRCRIERAKALLVEARLPISDIAFEVGYKSQSHFTTCFGRMTGVTPGAFRAGQVGV